MKPEDHLKETSYLDGELSTNECVEYENSLSEEQKASLEKTKRVHHGLEEGLRHDIRCPAEVWSRVQDQLNQKRREGQGYSLQKWMSIAALLLVGAFSWFLWDRSQPAQVQDAELFVQLKQWPSNMDIGNDIESARTSLKGMGLDVHIKDVPSVSHGHPTRFMGMNVVHSGQSSEGRLFFSCCDKSVVVRVLPVSSAKRSFAAFQKDPGITVSRFEKNIRNAHIQVMSLHGAKEIGDLFY